MLNKQHLVKCCKLSLKYRFEKRTKLRRRPVSNANVTHASSSQPSIGLPLHL